MPNWKDILAKERGRTWGAKMRSLFERELRKFHELNEELEKQIYENEALYKKRISQGTLKGLERARKKGKKLGGARRKPKYDRGRILTLARKGHSQSEIARRMHCSQPLIHRVLTAAKSTKTKARKHGRLPAR